MRNDARPIGHDAPGSPVGEHEPDARESVAHDRQFHVVNRAADEPNGHAADREPALPASDSTLKTKI